MQRSVRVPDDVPATALTLRQQEIAILIVKGLTNQEIAERLVLERGTVSNHVAQIMRRLGVTRRVQIAVWAVRQGLVSPDAGVC
jgi:DNA-binding NarL/FixJ family response regulator